MEKCNWFYESASNVKKEGVECFCVLDNMGYVRISRACCLKCLDHRLEQSNLVLVHEHSVIEHLGHVFLDVNTGSAFTIELCQFFEFLIERAFSYGYSQNLQFFNMCLNLLALLDKSFDMAIKKGIKHGDV